MEPTPQSATVYPVAFNHIGINVPDLQAALDWYQRIMGFRLLLGPYEVEGNVGTAGQIYVDIAGPTMRRTKVAQVAMGNGIGLELFQFIDPPTSTPEPVSATYYRPGPWHFAVTHPDVEGFRQLILDNGGKPISQVWSFMPEKPEFKLVYCYDPFGLIIEIFSHSYEQMLANRG